jgi:enoyl-[acyl-carrier protein] reductase I
MVRSYGTNQKADMSTLLKGKKGLIVGVANEASIAWGCAQVCAHHGAELALTYLNEKARPYVEPLAQQIECPIFMPLDVARPEQQQALFQALQQKWGRLDFVIHSIAFAPKIDLQSRVVDCSKEGFLAAMDISCHSLMRLTHDALPLMTAGGCILTMSFYGAEKVMKHYNLMGPVKAALETSVKYMADELGPQRIRVNALSTGPVSTRAASGVAHFDQLIEKAAAQAPLHQLVSIEQIGQMSAFLVSDNAMQVTGQTVYVDAGYNVTG